MNNSILIIDDEADICFLLTSILKERHLETSFANTLNEGLIKINLLKPRVLFLDINLPDGSGLDSIAKIKQLYPQIKIIIISAYDSFKDRISAIEQGADIFLSKPLNKNLIFSALDSLVH